MFCWTKIRFGVLTLLLLATSGCQPLITNNLRDRLAASHDRDWAIEMAKLPTAEFAGNAVEIRNIRNFNYVSEDEFVPYYYDRVVQVGDIQSVDFVVVPFKQSAALAHTMLSFGMRDGTHLAVSVEVRKEKDEKYQALLGTFNQFEVMYLVGDERDLIRLRTHHREDEVYVYPTIANAAQSQSLFVDVMQRVNELAGKPEFYHSLTNNCTTNLVEHVNNLKGDRVPFSWKTLLPGFSAKYAYDLGLLDNRIPFEDLQTLSHVNDLASTYYNASDFSQRIRSKRYLIERAIERANWRQARVNSPTLSR